MNKKIHRLYLESMTKNNFGVPELTSEVVSISSGH